MRLKLSKLARRQLLEIWQYSADLWGDAQANRYLQGLQETFQTLDGQRYKWQAIEFEKLQGLYFVPYEKHLIFFKETPRDKDFGIVGIYHHRMNWPIRLKKALSRPTK